MNTLVKPIMNMANLNEAVRNDLALSPQTRIAMGSAIIRFCEICGLDPTQVLADPAAVRALRKTASWQVAGISKRTWANAISLLTRAMSHVGIDVDRRRRNTRLSPAWVEFLNPLSIEAVKRIRRFAGFCSSREIAPDDVNAQSFADFLLYLQTQSVNWHVRDRLQEARSAWNKWVALPGSGYPQIAAAVPAGWRSRPWCEYPDSFQKDVETWRSHLDQADDDDDREPLRPATIKNYHQTLRRFISHLVDDGVPIEKIVSLSFILDPVLVKRGMKRVRGEQTDVEGRSGLHATAQALLSAARFIELDPKHPGYGEQQLRFAPLRKSAGKLRRQPNGMVRRNKDRLAKLDDPTAGRLFRNLHMTVAARHAGVTKPTLAAAQEMQMATAHAILLEAPLRMKNLASLDLDRHLTRPPGGRTGSSRIAFEGCEMKNHDALETQLGPEGSAFLDDYIKRFRPLFL